MNSLESNKTPHKLVVDRRFWGRGATGGRLARSLEEECANMCILGLYLNKVVRVPLRALKGEAAPSSMLNSRYNDTTRMFGDRKEGLRLVAQAGACWLINDESEGLRDSDVAKALIQINDDMKVTEETRERVIKDHFAKFNVEVEFIN